MSLLPTSLKVEVPATAAAAFTCNSNEQHASAAPQMPCHMRHKQRGRDRARSPSTECIHAGSEVDDVDAASYATDNDLYQVCNLPALCRVSKASNTFPRASLLVSQ
jgi:hypothetical protein